MFIHNNPFLSITAYSGFELSSEKETGLRNRESNCSAQLSEVIQGEHILVRFNERFGKSRVQKTLISLYLRTPCGRSWKIDVAKNDVP